ncbi:MAG: tetratricopeptide repeat protein [Bacteroidales bacterium]|nr:tetratricopeptide repeat protein [Bacteroidales bacterium]
MSGICYYPVVNNGFTNWDDPGYITENQTLKDLQSDNLQKIFTGFFMGNYHPLTMFSLAVDYNFVQSDPGWYHWVNLLFHLMNTLLTFFFIYNLTDKNSVIAAICALLFGIHPMHVESVAWISARKDVLYSFFFLLALIAWLKYLSSKSRSVLFYTLSLVLFILSVLCKPAAVIFPVIILLIGFYKKRPFKSSSLFEAIPFFIISVFFGLIAVKAQSQTSITEWDAIGIFYRIMFASYGLLAYLVKFLFPFHLSAFYPYPTRFPITETLPLIYYLAPFIIAGLFILVFISLKHSRDYIFGFLFFFFNVALVLQFISVGASMMADRYTYLPYLGLSFIVGALSDRVFNRSLSSSKPLKFIALSMLIGYGLMLSILTRQRIRVWENSNMLWSDVISKYPGQVATAYKNRGNYLVRDEKEYEKGLQDYNAFIAIEPKNATIFNNRGNLYFLMGQFDLSLKDYNVSLSIDSNYYDGLVNRSLLLMKMNKFDLALRDINQAILQKPGIPANYKTRAWCYLQSGNYKAAIKDYDKIIVWGPPDASSYLYRGIAQFNSKRLQESMNDFSAAIKTDPALTDAWFNRSQVYFRLGDYKNAVEDARKAQQLGAKIPPEYISRLMKQENKVK